MSLFFNGWFQFGSITGLTVLLSAAGVSLPHSILGACLPFIIINLIGAAYNISKL